jgi:hypothetical protein
VTTASCKQYPQTSVPVLQALDVVGRAHAPLGPSAMDRWSRCGACIRLSKGLGAAAPGPAATAGTILHGAYERCQLGGTGLTRAELLHLEACGVSSARAHTILNQALRATATLFDRYGVRHFVTEVRVDPGRRIGRNDYWGTCDLLGVAPASRTVILADFKSGRGVVDPVDNLQLLSYCLGALDLLDFTPQRLVLAIVQPPVFGDEAAVWETTPDVLMQFEQYARERAAATDDPTALPVASPEACQWCPARPICPALCDEGGTP